ncbi:hypothetical protein ACN47E_000144 [Coniothyrium glycines]
MATEAPLPVDSHHALDAPHGDAPAEPTPKPVVKRSWRRKYRKMRVRFDNAMSYSNNLILQEWKAMGTARRLQETNDQLLELLLDLNEQARVHPRLRYDLRDLSAADAALPSLEAAEAPEHVQQQLQVLRDDVARGNITAEEFTARAGQLQPSSQPVQPTLTSLASLEAKVPHTERASLPERPIPGLDLSDHAPGYMTPTHEEEYLLATDQILADPAFDQSLQLGRPIRLPTAQPPLGDKELTIRNPDSVYNWLRKHQPQVFLQDKDAAHPENVSEKSAPKNGNAGGKKTKRESAIGGGTPGPRDHDDDDLAEPGTSKGRRKPGAEDDTAYRPKGGSSRPAKRKREDGDTPAGKSRSKKSRASTGAAA